MTSQLKDKLGQAAVEHIGQLLTSVWPSFEQQGFVQDCCNNLAMLELKQRVQHIVDVLGAYLPSDFRETGNILLAAGQQLRSEQDTKGWSDYAAWPLIDFVAKFGQHNIPLSMLVLKALTPLFTAEFAIRPFINNHFEQVLPYLQQWCDDSDEHVRRLASEAVRPRLPWGGHLQRFCEDPTPILPILEKLKDDHSRYVQKSVANNINDISKDHADVVLALCRKWQSQASSQRNWIIRHGLRGLIKQGHQEVFSLLGYSEMVSLKKVSLQFDTDSLGIGEALLLRLILWPAGKEQQRLVVDYRVHHVLANGRRGSKVYKWKNITLPASETVTLEKRHLFKQMSTRRYYTGNHTIEVLVNGVVVANASFWLAIE